MKKKPSFHTLVHRRIKTLKLKMATETDFDQIYSYFFTYLGENKNFLKMGQPADNELLSQVLVQIAQAVTHTENIQLTQLMVYHLSNHDFWHGACLFNGYLATMFYFEDIDAGMLAIVGALKIGQTEIIRFSIERLHQPYRPVN